MKEKHMSCAACGKNRTHSQDFLCRPFIFIRFQAKRANKSGDVCPPSHLCLFLVTCPRDVTKQSVAVSSAVHALICFLFANRMHFKN
ncbi:hypothetical protein CEXT_787331 [Caerostris extrusa]|uniref:Uncharacterized protein n=1 Tax=Caerostris extrusa TaxID=172846 RepID=A0AAV4R0L4_CAEEX|nr:hypothetical protein CEXT_787331 [Caerostris extrusa]